MAVQIYVGNLPYSITEDALKGYFEPHGIIESVKIIKDHDSGRSKGYGFIEMASQDEANTAVEKLNDSLIDERKIKVSIAKPRERRSNYQPRN